MATSAPQKPRPSRLPALNMPSRGKDITHSSPTPLDDTPPRRASVPNPRVRESRTSFSAASGSRGPQTQRSGDSQKTPRITNTRSLFRSSDPGSRVGILPKSRKGPEGKDIDLLALPKIPPPTLLSADQIALMDRLAQILDEDPEVDKPGASMVKRMIDEEKIHHLHAEEEEAARHADRDRKKVIKKDKRSVFGVHLRVVQYYASLMFLLGDTQPHRIPTVVCVVLEQLYHRISTGECHQNTFAPLPPTLPESVKSLVDFFSLAPKFGDDEPTPVKTASARELSHLLLYFLQSLPDPTLDSSIFHILVDLCALPSVHAAQMNKKQCSIHAERYRIQIAKLTLRLLPNSQFALLVHLLAFFSHMPRFDISLVQVANTFGPAICCPRDGLSYLRGEGVFAEDKITLEDTLEHGSQEYVAKISKELLLWLLLYWDQIADGLLEDEVEDDLRKFVDGLEDGDGDDYEGSDEDDFSFIYQPPPYLPGRTVLSTAVPPSISSPSPSMLSSSQSSHSPPYSLFPLGYHMGNPGEKGTKHLG